MKPLLWNTLNEAADWLTAATAEKWSAKHVLSAALVHNSKTYLKAALPRETQFALYEFSAEKGTPDKPFVRKCSSPWRTVPLYQKHVYELLLHGETSASIALSPDGHDGVENEYIFIEPLDLHQGHTIVVSTVGITAADLMDLSRKVAPAQLPAAAAKESGTHSTKELELLYKAIAEFWDNHDPKAPPKKDVVVKWFTDKGVSKGVAESLDTVMRTPAARKGGNKRVQTTTNNG